jgi:hypothetical protein
LFGSTPNDAYWIVITADGVVGQVYSRNGRRSLLYENDRIDTSHLPYKAGTNHAKITKQKGGKRIKAFPIYRFKFFIRMPIIRLSNKDKNLNQ